MTDEELFGELLAWVEEQHPNELVHLPGPLLAQLLACEECVQSDDEVSALPEAACAFHLGAIAGVMVAHAEHDDQRHGVN